MRDRNSANSRRRVKGRRDSHLCQWQAEGARDPICILLLTVKENREFEIRLKTESLVNQNLSAVECGRRSCKSSASCSTTVALTRMSIYANTPSSRSCWSIVRSICVRRSAPASCPRHQFVCAGMRRLPNRRSSRNAQLARARMPAMTRIRLSSKSRLSTM